MFFFILFRPDENCIFMNKIAYLYETSNGSDYNARTAAAGFKNAFTERGDSFRLFDLDKLKISYWPAEKIKLTNFNPDIIFTAVENVRYLPLNLLKPTSLVLSGAFYSPSNYDDRIRILTEKAKKVLNKYSSRHKMLILSPYNEQINTRFFSGYETELGLKLIQQLHCINPDTLTEPVLKPEFDFLWLGNTTRRLSAYKSLIAPLKKEFSNFLEYTQHNMIDPEIAASDQLYARAYILPNLHTEAQLKYDMLINQRLFTAAAFGGFQICNNALARKHFNEDELVIATESSDFMEKTRHYISHPEERLRMIKKMQDKLIKHHTYFNRVNEIMTALG